MTGRIVTLDQLRAQRNGTPRRPTTRDLLRAMQAIQVRLQAAQALVSGLSKALVTLDDALGPKYLPDSIEIAGARKAAGDMRRVLAEVERRKGLQAELAADARKGEG